MTARRPGRAPAAVALALLAALATACGGQQPGTATAPATPAVRPALVTAAVGQAGNGWAIVPMGGPAAQHENFWELFTRRSAAAAWKLVTPAGVADNGGLVVAAGRGNGSLVTGFVPSQDLTFSPLASTSDDGASWSPGLLSGGLAGTPGSLADAPDGRLLAILRTGAVELSGPGGTSWRRLTDQRSLAATPAGRACGLVRLTAAAFNSSAEPLLAGQCTRPGAVGVFGYSGGSWHLAGPELPAAPADSRIEVIALTSTGAGEAALLAAGSGQDKSLIAAWSTGSAARWTLSAPFRMEADQLRSASAGSNGGMGIVLNASVGATLAGPRRSWRRLPALPARTATLVAGPGSLLEALTTTSATLSVWRLAGRAAAWTHAQTIRVPIPYGSSS